MVEQAIDQVFAGIEKSILENSKPEDKVKKEKNISETNIVL